MLEFICTRCRQRPKPEERAHIRQLRCPACRGRLASPGAGVPVARKLATGGQEPRTGILVDYRPSKTVRRWDAVARPEAREAVVPMAMPAPRANWLGRASMAVGVCLVLTAGMGLLALSLPKAGAPQFDAGKRAVAVPATPLPLLMVRSVPVVPAPVAPADPIRPARAAIDPVAAASAPAKKVDDRRARVDNEAVHRITEFKRRDLLTDAHLRAQLRGIREIDLDGKAGTTMQVIAEAQRQAPPAAAIQKKDKAALAAQEPAKVSGLPRVSLVLSQRWDALGLAATKGKECQTSPESAASMETTASSLRTMGIVSVPGRGGRLGLGGRGMGLGTRGEDGGMQLLAAALNMRGKANPEAALPAVVQMLQAEEQTGRMVLVRWLSSVSGEAASKALAQRALYDTAPEVREAAVRALNDRPREEYREVLVKGFRYPWAPVADHAAEAVIALRDREVLAALQEMVEEQDPSQPRGGKLEEGQQPNLREVVRINHLRNCVMCHAPSFSPSDKAVGPVPVAGKELPIAYYGNHNRSTLPDSKFVRADVTYLRQDFSVPQEVEKAEPWPEMQRYDYIVRTRSMTPEEVEQRKREDFVSPQREAVRYAIEELSK